MAVASPDPPPNTSPLVAALDKATQIPSDAIVVRGYLGRSDILENALSLLKSLAAAAGANAAPKTPLTDAEYQQVDPIINKAIPPDKTSAVPWRMYLSPKLDCYIEFNWSEDVIAYNQETEADREGAYTVWLKRRPDQQTPYRVVDVQPLNTATGYVRGDLIEDYLSRPEASTIWDEQDTRLSGFKPSGRTCQR